MPNEREALQNLILAYQNYRNKASLTVAESIKRMREEQERIRKEIEKQRQEREGATKS